MRAACSGRHNTGACLKSAPTPISPSAAYRDPRYGRGQETGGEDAWLNEQVATEYVLGLQGGPAKGDGMLLATAACKHILVLSCPSLVSSCPRVLVSSCPPRRGVQAHSGALVPLPFPERCHDLG